jgi:hypothetical protein
VPALVDRRVDLPPTAKIHRVHVTLTRATTSDQPIQNAAVVAEEMVRWLRDIDGFEGMLMVSREGESIGLVFWASKEVALRNQTIRKQFRERMLSVAGVKLEESVDYELMFAAIADRVRDFSG